jgi:hypothetical protein
MFEMCRPLRRLFLCLLVLMAQGLAQTVPMTTVQEVRWSDSGWGPYNDRNLAGRFTTQTFTLPRLSKIQDYYLRQYDGSPPKYSRYSTALHVDFPL